MAYNASIPQPTDLLKDSQGDILANFQAINTLVGVNHVGFNTTDSGKHKYVEFPVQGSTPPIVFPAGELALYSYLNPTTNKNELYINKTNQATVVQVPMTSSLLSAVSSPIQGEAGWSYLPSGILIKWGLGQATNPVTAQDFPVSSASSATIPTFTQIFSMTCTIQDTGGGDPNTTVYLQSFTTVAGKITKYTAKAFRRNSPGTSVACLFYYVAIGM